MQKRDCCDPCTLILLAFLLAYPICKNWSADRMNIFGNFIVAFGGLLLSAAAKKSSQESKCSSAKSDAQLQQLQDEIDDLQKKLRQLTPEVSKP